MIRAILLLFLAIFLVTVSFPFILIFQLFRKKDRAQYLLNIAIGLDQLGGCLLYNQVDWTVSSWTYYRYKMTNGKEYKWFMKFIDLLFGKDHCSKAFDHEMNNTKEILNDIYASVPDKK